MNDPDLAEKAVNVKHTPTIRDFIHNSMSFWLKFFLGMIQKNQMHEESF